jgi:uncharacterized protein Yka (UPF0111/DUF47 family)
MFGKLLPKEERYFEDFKDSISHVQEIAKLTHAFFVADTYDKDIFLKLKPLENRCGEIKSKVIKRLNKTFITPLDREDIFSLIKKIDNIGEILVGAASRVDTYSVNEKVDSAAKMASIVVQQTKELEIALQDLKHKSSQINECKAVQDLETEADNIYRAALKKLFTEEKDPIKLIKKKEILEMLEIASDMCQSTANVIIEILIKNS